MRAEQSFSSSINPEPIRDLFKVAQWKYDVDPGEPWWKRAYFKWIFLPFLRFSFKRFKVPIVKEALVESDEYGRTRVTFSWFEDQGLFEDEDAAASACLGEHWGYKKLPVNRLMPPESAQYSGTVYPRAKKPRRWARPTLSMVIRDRKQDEQRENALAECLAQVNQVLDRPR